jgi:hypothetical protein
VVANANKLARVKHRGTCIQNVFHELRHQVIVPESLKSPIPVSSASAPPTADEGDIGISPDQQILASSPVEFAEPPTYVFC